MKNLILFLAAALMLAGLVTSAARAQDALPQLPDPIQNLVNDGAQIRYLGKDHGFDAWLTIKNGQEQYFYVLPDRSAFVMGVLFDGTGKAVTVQQVRRLQQEGDEMLDALASDTPSANNDTDAFALKSPAEKLFSDIEGSNWVPLGAANAPVVYSFIDPQCPHCHAFIDDLRKTYLPEGRIQLRLIPVGFREETLAQAAFLLAAPDPGARFLRHMDGDETALPARKDINTQGVQRNLSIMQTWGLNVTPLIIYRDKAGEVKIVRGRPKDIAGFIADLPPAG